MARQNETGYRDLVEEHSIEGIEVLQGTSSLIAHAILYLIMAMIAAAFVWAFCTSADVVISTKGQLKERTDSKRIYSPAAGELIEMFVSEGVPVDKGDLLARVRSPQAIQIASAAVQAKLMLEDAAVMKERFPDQKKLMERELDSMLQKNNMMQTEYDRQKKEGLRQLSGTQKRQLEVLRIQVSEKKLASDQAEELFGKYKRLFNSPGSGGISKKDFLEKESEFKRAESAYQQAISQIEDLELTFASQYLASSQKIEQVNMELIQGKLQYDQKKTMIARTANQIEMKYLGALEGWKAASKVNYSDLDDNNFLVLRAPVSGEVSSVWFHQAGEKINPNAPLLAISPKESGKAVRLTILDKDRGLLKVGQPVKLKFHAFPYQRFGFLTGKLEYLSNNAVQTKDGRSQYKGKVSLAKDYYTVNGRQLPIRFGMNADVEIVVQRRRVIDFVLDPFKKLVNK